jgi:hypothetical protein
VLGQLGNRVQHALRAFTPRDQKAVRTAAQTMRPNPGLDIEAAITELGVGEALISFLDEKGRPMPTQRAWIASPASRIGPASAAECAALKQASPMAAKYGPAVDRESAYEVLAARAGKPVSGASVPDPGAGGAPMGQGGGAVPPASPGGGFMDGLNDVLFGSTGPRGGRHDGIVQSAARSAVRSVATELARGLLGSLLGSKRRR